MGTFPAAGAGWLLCTPAWQPVKGLGVPPRVSHCRAGPQPVSAGGEGWSLGFPEFSYLPSGIRINSGVVGG